jgi:hypothetical protein
MLPGEPKQFLLRKALSPAAADAVEADDSRFLSIKLPKSTSVAQKIHGEDFPLLSGMNTESDFISPDVKSFLGL